MTDDDDDLDECGEDSAQYDSDDSDECRKLCHVNIMSSNNQPTHLLIHANSAAVK